MRVIARRGMTAATMQEIAEEAGVAKGTIYLWTMPQNFGDLYSLPRPMVTRIKDYLFGDAPVKIDAPDHVALFTYDNGAFVVQNFRDSAAHVAVSAKGKSAFAVDLPPHSFRVFPAR